VLLRLAGGRYSISSEEGLRIRNISQADDGEYTCRAEVRDAGRYDEKRITVAVHSQCSTFRFRVRLFALVTHTHTHTAESSSITDRDYITRISGKSGEVDRRIRWHYTTTILRLRIGARLTRYRNCKFHNFAPTISRHADGMSRYFVPPSAGLLLPLTRMIFKNIY